MALMIRYFVFHIAKVRTWSMFPNFYFEDIVLISPLPYRFSKIQRGDVLAFSSYGKEFYLKRVIALPGDEVQWREGRFILNGQALDERPVSMSKGQERVLPFVLKGRKETLLEKTGLYLEFLPEKRRSYLVLKNNSFILEEKFLRVPKGHFLLLSDDRTLLNTDLKQNLVPISSVHGFVFF